MGRNRENLVSTNHQRANVNTNQIIGLAISGGVDSMALAALCSRLQSASQSQEGEAPPLTEFQAFVVDHGVREGSNDEANSVARIMGEKGIYDDLKL